MQPVLTQPFTSVPGTAFVSESFKIPTSAFGFYVFCASDQDGTLVVQLRDGVNAAWVPITSDSTTATGTVVTYGIGGVEARATWLPGGAGGSSSVTLYYGYYGTP